MDLSVVAQEWTSESHENFQARDILSRGKFP